MVTSISGLTLFYQVFILSNRFISKQQKQLLECILCFGGIV